MLDSGGLQAESSCLCTADILMGKKDSKWVDRMVSNSDGSIKKIEEGGTWWRMIRGWGGVTLQRVVKKDFPEQDLNEEKKVDMHLGISGWENCKCRSPKVEINVVAERRRWIWDVSRVLIIYDLVGQVKNFEVYANCIGKPLAGLAQEMQWSDFYFHRDHSGCSIANGFELGQRRENLGAVVVSRPSIGSFIFYFGWVHAFFSVPTCSSYIWRRTISVLCKIKILVFQNIRKCYQRVW